MVRSRTCDRSLGEECTCDVVFRELRRMDRDAPSSVHRYISAVTNKWNCDHCVRRGHQETYFHDRFSAGLVQGVHYLRRKLNKIAIKCSPHQSDECSCDVVFWELRRMDRETPSSVHRYISAVTNKWICHHCLRRDRPPPALAEAPLHLGIPCNLGPSTAGPPLPPKLRLPPKLPANQVPAVTPKVYLLRPS